MEPPLKMKEAEKQSMSETDMMISKAIKQAEIDRMMMLKGKKKEKKAVLIGLKHPDPQMNTVDVKGQILRMKNHLMKLRGFSEDNITLMIQDEEEPDNTPTDFNISRTLCSLVLSAWSGDIVFIHLIAYGCSDGRIITADNEHVFDNFFRGLIYVARQNKTNLTIVSDCLISPVAKCPCPKNPLGRKPWGKMNLEERKKELEKARAIRLSTPAEPVTIGFSFTGPTSLSSVNILNSNDKNKATQDVDHRVILLMPFTRDPNAATNVHASELFFCPPPNGAGASSPQHRTLYGGFTKAILDVIEETHDAQLTNLDLAKKAMGKLGGQIPSLLCDSQDHAYASFLC
ncbi:metacaspase-6-like [Lotus japonicus]|uniref:metacaspase-6-like n=1 Tax=Lotus japonicus TaxID=34305 RepID=UPI0025865414|nr:metacaspase-6-like [Lotus japonicus]